MDTFWFIAITACVYCGLVAMVLYLLYRFYKYLLWGSDIIGNDLRTRLINLGITALFFSSFGVFLFIKPFSFLVKCSATVVSSLSMFSKQTSKPIAYNDIAPFLNKVLTVIGGGLKGSGLVSHLFLPFVFTVILNMAGTAIFTNPDNNFFASANMKKLISANIRQNVTLFFLIVVSLYFVLCAITAIPYSGFYNSADYNSKSDSLKYDRRPPDLTKLKIGNNWAIDSAVIFKFIADNKSNAATTDKKAIQVQLLLNSAQTYFLPRYANLSNQVNRINGIIVNTSKAFEDKCSQFNDEVNKNDLSAKLKANYSAEVSRWLNYNLQTKQYSISSIVDAEKAYVTTLNQKVTDFKTKASSFINFKRRGKDSVLIDTSQLFSPGYFDGSALNPAFDVLAVGLDNLTDLPPRPNIGADWGPVGNAASWLISTQSLDLALIVGMFGFGFLGAAISSFVNVRQNMKNNKPIVENLLVVVIRGFSAAIVVFLATKGGIAVFTDGSAAEPNPYVLFFTCLLGAVFSERIWDWAKTQITSKYPINGGAGVPKVSKTDEAIPEAGSDADTVGDERASSNEGKSDSATEDETNV